MRGLVVLRFIALLALLAVVILAAAGVIRDWAPFAIGGCVALLEIGWKRMRHAPR
jgi:hypothetical protein